MNRSFERRVIGSRVGSISLLAAASLAIGCGQDAIEAYIIPKEPPQSMPADLPPGHPPLDGVHAPQPFAANEGAPDAPATPPPPPRLTWQTPDGWQEVAPGQFRVASFLVTGKDGAKADVSVTPLPGDAGGDLSNVNRWRGQVGEKPIPARALSALAQSIELDGQPASVYHIHGINSDGEPARILAAIQQRDGTAWFFKMTGDSQLVAGQKPVFIDFLKSFRFSGGEEMAAAEGMVNDVQLPPGHPEISDTPTNSNRRWEVPTHWKEVPAGAFLKAKFAVQGEDNGQTAVNVSSSPGDGGGLPANVNRWRQQLGLQPLSQTELEQSAKSFETASGPATLVEMTGKDARTSAPASIVGALVIGPDQSWFYKLMGDPKIVAAEKAAFIKFVQGVKH